MVDLNADGVQKATAFNDMAIKISVFRYVLMREPVANKYNCWGRVSIQCLQNSQYIIA